MFVKCTNSGCPNAFYYSLGAMVFEVQSGSGEYSEQEEPPVAYHWFCPECLPILLTAWFDHGAGRAEEDAKRRVRLISLESALASARERSPAPAAGPAQADVVHAS